MISKRLRIFLAIFLIAILGCIGWQLLQKPDEGPAADGKSMSQWLDDVGVKSGDLSPSAVAALQKIGPESAFPWLLKESARNQPGIFQVVRHLIEIQPLINIHLKPPPDHQARVLRGFRAFGAAGAQAIVNGLTNSDRSIRFGCVGQWEMGKTHPTIIFPALLNALNDPASSVRARAANAVGMLSLQPEKAVPALIGLLSDRDDNVRSMGALGLSLYNTNATAATPTLLKMLTARHSSEFEFFGTNALKSIDPSTLAKLTAQRAANQ